MLNQATQKFSKMHARRNPNLSIQSTAPYSQLSPPPQSATSGAFLSPTIASRRGLLSRSPPPSPSLPSLIPRHGKKQPQPSHSGLVKRILIGCCGVAFLVWIILRQLYSSSQQAVSYEEDGDEWEMVGGSRLPHEPSAVAVQDANGKMRWTVSIPSTFEFPLRPAQYREICHQSMEVSKGLRQEAQGTGSFAKRMLNYYQQDQYYIDVQEAEEQALLPPNRVPGRPKGFVEDESVAGGTYTTGLKVCDKTLTYVMETEDAGFGISLMRMWMSYGLAQAENRAFFIDDTRWPYGRYKTYFQPPPAAGCLPPPKTHMVPCPHNARHIVVSAATVHSTFGHSFTEEWEDATKMRVQRQHKIFSLVRTGYEALFKLRTDDAEYVVNRALELYGAMKQEGGLSIGMHVRHGDKHPMEYQYQKDYIPLDRYIDTARELYIDLVEGNPKHKHTSEESKALLARHTSSKLILASDDPMVYESPELGPNSIRAQDRIVLATKAALEAAQAQHKKNKWIDEITGWEGGFYRDVFFSLGQPVGNADDMNKLSNTEEVPEGAMKLRELVGRAYLMDMAVLGKADTIVCTVSSVTCRLLAVMMGWEGAIGERRWRNIDGAFEWRGIIW
ncbi:uncharacterized protein K460DRAFT_355449 [Cucurbitaria berberidis CBS 394.84]|uniref:Uncharacterized protein n=1 Tax=Cucurbitaria berberidis CBS 394.84 TaxID=1168544 RepID=A0A9P4L850_9PLEO|nr:uncharacterized protein K460DRAFT_355449 [Cucurbitaria berberidis CBS 394.84]KAF1845660.1 hypothetical protein K460DRAFT_355449 [Cucurbitaria berberidis CBS 394.84]